jgi:hypothetical protein
MVPSRWPGLFLVTSRSGFLSARSNPASSATAHPFVALKAAIEQVQQEYAFSLPTDDNGGDDVSLPVAATSSISSLHGTANCQTLIAH